MQRRGAACGDVIYEVRELIEEGGNVGRSLLKREGGGRVAAAGINRAGVGVVILVCGLDS